VRHDIDMLTGFRTLFGDERQDYAKALQKHYREGPPASSGHCSSSAAMPPRIRGRTGLKRGAHYLHITDTVNTATSFRIDTDQAETESEPFEERHLWRSDLPGARHFLELMNAWVRQTQAMNELARSMGQPDGYPFMLP
jgi:hypothetical protein